VSARYVIPAVVVWKCYRLKEQHRLIIQHFQTNLQNKHQVKSLFEGKQR